MEKGTTKRHMILADRCDIEECLAKGMTFKDIGKRLNKSATTISREIRKHTYPQRNGFTNREDICSLLTKAPFVCNGCEKRSRSSCQFIRQMYMAKRAQAEYEQVLSESRTGIPLNKESFYETERVISSSVKNGQHIYHIIQTHNLPVSSATVYRHIKKGYYSISPIDLPRAVKFTPRYTKQIAYVPGWAKKGRTYEDYLSYIENNPDLYTVQFDTVIGRIGGKVIMTIHFVNCDFMTGILLENKTAAEAASKISLWKETLKCHGFSFGNIIPIILTDNGGEFSNVDAFERNSSGILETHMFFCDSNASYEKPHIEKNHTLLRDILPSSSSFDNLSQEKVNLIFSHINSVKRKLFNGKSAYDVFSFTFSEELASAVGIQPIPADKVIQTPLLLN